MIIDEELIPYIDELYQHARSKISFYKDIYLNSPDKISKVEDFKTLPQINDGFFVRHRLEDMITSYEDIYKVAYPEHKFINDSTIPRVYDLEDLDNQYEILDWILDECGSFDEGLENRIALIIDEENSYEMGDLGQMLALIMECPVFAMVVRGHSAEEIKSELEKVSTNTIFTSVSLSDDALPDSINKIYTIGSKCNYHGNMESYNLWTNPYVGFIGYRNMKDNMFRVNPDFYILETNERGQIVVTSFMQKILPMIRYQTRDYGRVIDSSTVKIAYRGTH